MTMKFFISLFIALLGCTSLATDSGAGCFHALKRHFVNHKEYYVFEPHKIKSAENLEDLESYFGNKSYIQLQEKFKEEDILKINGKTLLLIEQTTPAPQKNLKTSLNYSQIKELFQAIIDGHNIGKQGISEQDCIKIGFCFARAGIGHFEALMRNVHPSAIKKIWAMGKMASDVEGRYWKYHVSAVVRGEDSWYVLDTNLGIKTPREWMDHYTKVTQDGAKKPLFLISQPTRDNVHRNINYNINNLLQPENRDELKGYFHRYLNSLVESGIEKSFSE